MSCENVQERISLFLNHKLEIEERENVLEHTGMCRDCAARLAWLESQRETMRRMALAPIPESLATRLSVLASHERERQLARVSVRVRLSRLAANLNLTFNNLMRPVAL